MTLGHGEAWCAAHPGTSCDGDVLVTCGDPSTMQAVDCRLGGNHCQGADGQAQCLTREGCTQSGSYCTGEASWAYCQSSGAETNYGCQPGEHCWDVPSTGAAVCLPSAPCSSPETSRCDGTVVRTCQSVEGGSPYEQTSDCGSWGVGVCNEAGDQAWCDYPNAECAGDRCEGSTVEACVFGKTLSLDCRQLGFSSCTSGNGTAGCL
jgi:hypothetical protein